MAGMNEAAQGMYAAVVHGPAGVNFIAVRADLEALWHRLGSYVQEWAPVQLADTALEVVNTALQRRDFEGAVRTYFEHAGRWDPETLVVEKLDPSSVYCGSGPPRRPSTP